VHVVPVGNGPGSAIANPRARYAQIAFWLIVAAVVFLMVVKPFT
jgi:hypothetical protein